MRLPGKRKGACKRWNRQQHPLRFLLDLSPSSDLLCALGFCPSQSRCCSFDVCAGGRGSSAKEAKEGIQEEGEAEERGEEGEGVQKEIGSEMGEDSAPVTEATVVVCSQAVDLTVIIRSVDV